jgi:hypothetical protein
MSIETKIEALTAALTENTAALREVLAASGKTTPAETPKPDRVKKKEKPAAEEKVEDTTPEEKPAETEAPTAAELVQRITEVVKNAITAPGANAAAVKDAWRAVCAEFGVEKISGLDDVDKLQEALAKAEAL